MFRETFWFELKFRLRSKATWIVLAVDLFSCWRDMSGGFWDELMGSGRVARNSPFAAYYILMLSVFWAILLGSGFMTAPFLRDLRLRVAPLIYSKPVPDRGYFLGKFCAGLVGVAIPMLGTVIGFLTLPWYAALVGRPASDFMAAPLAHFGFAWLLFVLPGILLQGAMQSFLAVRTGRVAFSIAAVVMWFLIWIMIDVATKGVVAPVWLQTVDPLGKSTLEGQILYWTADERMSRFVTLGGPLLWNKLLWLGLSAALFVAAFWRFDLRALLVREWSREAKRSAARDLPAPRIAAAAKIVPLRPAASFAIWLRFALSQAWQEFRLCTSSVAFRSLMAFCLMAALIAATRSGAMFPQPDGRLLPATWDIYTLAANTYFTGLILTLLYFSGEIVARERTARTHLMVEASPVPDWTRLLSKLGGVVLLTAFVAAIPLAGTALAAALGGWLDGGWPLLALRVMLDLFLPALAFGALAVACHLAIPHRGVAHGIGVIAFITVIVGHEIEVIESSFWQFGFPLLTLRSDWNIHASSLEKLLWLDAWWLSLGAVLLAVAMLFWSRGVTGTRARWRQAASRLRPPALAALLITCSAAAAIGAGLWQRMVVQGDFQSRATENAEAAAYEKTFAPARDVPQPKLTRAELGVELFPAERRATYRGAFAVENRTSEPVTELHLERASFTALGPVEWNGAQLAVRGPEQLRVAIFPLPQPLAPGATAALVLSATAHYRHFSNEELHGKLFADGSLFTHALWPRLGYQHDRELLPVTERRKHGLGPRRGLPPVGSPVRDLAQNDDADLLEIDLRVTTDAGQEIAAPGVLVAESANGARRTFHFHSAAAPWDAPFTSGRYAGIDTTWQPASGAPVRIAIRHHPQHGANAARFAAAAQAALAQLSPVLGAYPWPELRIVETPHLPEPHHKDFHPTASGNLLLIPERRGWLHDYRPGDAGMDYITFVVARELARGWLSQIAPAAEVQGGLVLRDALPNYFGLVALEAAHGPTAADAYAAVLTERYLRECALEDDREPSLVAADGQKYLAEKGALAFLAAHRALGADKMRGTLANALAPRRMQPPFTQASDLSVPLIAAAPENRREEIRDFFTQVIQLKLPSPK